MRALNVSLTVLLLSVASLVAQEPTATQPYDDVDAYRVYSLLLPHEEAYSFAKDALMIQEDAVPEDISGACLRQTDASRFKGAIAGYNRTNRTKWLFQRQFQIAKPYRIVSPKLISALPDRPQGAVSYVRMSAVGFNRDKTQAVVFVASSCGGLCGHWQFHILEKAHGKWSEIPVAMCVGAS